jgi:NADPH:quinone reductase-like Zn-dependent oxidoreductase
VARARDQATLETLAQLVIGGALNPYVSRTFTLDQAAEALRLIEQGHVRGKVVIEVTQ